MNLSSMQCDSRLFREEPAGPAVRELWDRLGRRKFLEEHKATDADVPKIRAAIENAEYCAAATERLERKESEERRRKEAAANTWVNVEHTAPPYLARCGR